MKETVRVDYAPASAEALLEALDQAGRKPDRDLLEACLERRDALVPGLLRWLEEGVDQGYEEDWDDDDPRWYREIHAGMLLIAFREEQALSLFDLIFRDPDREGLHDWFTGPFRNYGAMAVDTLIDLVKDRKAEIWSRIGAGEILKDIALMHPEVRERVVEALRSRLPRVDEEGAFVIPPYGDIEQVALWSWVALDLARLQDAASQPQGTALYKAGLIDEQVMGDLERYLAIFDEDPRIPEPFDLIAYHHPSPETLALREAARKKLDEELEAPFLALSTDELLRKVAEAGYAPEPSLIRVCLKRQKALVPGLLRVAAQYANEVGDEDEEEGSEWYGGLLATNLLIAFREEEALPFIEDILRKDKLGFLLEEAEEALPYYGPVVLPMFGRLLKDVAVPSWTRIAAALMSKVVAQLHPEAKPQVEAMLHAALPPTTERGDPDVPSVVSEDQMSLWTFVALALARLGHTASQTQIETLFDWDLIDKNIYGDYETYVKDLHEEEDPVIPPPQYDLEQVYVERYIANPLARDDEPFPDLSLLFEDEEKEEPSYPIGYGGEATFIREAPKVGRNDPCPCGSGRKFKKCCGRK